MSNTQDHLNLKGFDLDPEKSTNEQEMKRCAVCGTSANKQCSGCRLVSYCDQAHQKQHWKEHKKECGPLQLKENEDFGKHFVATRDLKAGNVILGEVPLAAGPAVSENTDEFIIRQMDGKAFLLTGMMFTCLGCCSVHPKIHAKRCSKCKWPICSEACEKNSHHAENECKLFSKQKTGFSSHLWPLIDKILVLRTCLLKDKNPNAWKAVLNMQHESIYSYAKEHVRKDDGSVVRKISEIDQNAVLTKSQNELRQLKLEKTILLEDWIRVSNAVKINAVAALTGIGKIIFARSGLFTKSSVFAYSCVPNCSRTISPAPGFQIEMKTNVRIPKGEPLTIAYNGACNDYGTIRRALAMTEFLCKCTRCRDPFELGSNCSTWICEGCKGPMVSTNPLVPNADWKCTNCALAKTAGVVLKKLNSMLEAIELCTRKKKQVVPGLQSIIGNATEMFHPNHFVILRAHQAIFTRMLFDQPTMEECIQRFVQKDFGNEIEQTVVTSTRQMLAVYEYIHPGLTSEKAYLQMMLALALAQDGGLRFFNGNMTAAEQITHYNEILELCYESLVYYKTNRTEAETGSTNIKKMLSIIHDTKKVLDTPPMNIVVEKREDGSWLYRSADDH